MTLRRKAKRKEKKRKGIEREKLLRWTVHRGRAVHCSCAACLSFPGSGTLERRPGIRCADNHADLGSSPGAARFVTACLEINPSWSRTLPTALEQAAALEAYRSAQGRVTPRDMEMLKAYYASGLTHDRSNKAFGVRTAVKSFGSASATF